jgi:transketolase
MSTPVKIESDLGKKAADTIRMLSADAVQKANSGHPGLPMGAADLAFVLWAKHMRFDPDDPNWPGRDRFILSPGHGSTLQYSLLHLFGFDLSLDQIKQFRQLDSITPGHPEYGVTPGVETTTGPLGQGFANGVGMAMAAKFAEANFAADGFCPAGTRIFGLVSDGDLMEGISYEAAAMAGHMKLDNLVYLYDSNRITIEGGTDLAWSENIPERFKAAGWNVDEVDGHDHDQLDKAIAAAIEVKDQPTLIVCKTHIAFGSPNKQDTSGSHGAPLGEEELLATKKALGYPEESFFIQEDVKKLFSELAGAKKADHAAYTTTLAGWKSANPEKSEAWNNWTSGDVPDGLVEKMIEALPDKDDATRNYSGVVLQPAAQALPYLIGGSADLAPSNKTMIKGVDDFAAGSYHGRNLHFGIREHAMGAVANGMALYGGAKPYVATFLVFADYMRTTIRLAALMEIPVIFMFSHDSFWVGEDGPTHQPIEHIASLRIIPNTMVIRPADGVETAVAWDLALRRSDGPTVLLTSRQKIVRFEYPENTGPAAIAKGGYVISPAKDAACKNVVVASGSEVSTAIQSQRILAEKGIDLSVVSVPCRELFLKQDRSYREQVISPEAENVIVVEASYDPGWWQLIRCNGDVVDLPHFGASAPGKVLAEHFGFTSEKVAGKIEKIIQGA